MTNDECYEKNQLNSIKNLFNKELFEYTHHMIYKEWIEERKKLLIAIIIVLDLIHPRENVGEQKAGERLIMIAYKNLYF